MDLIPSSYRNWQWQKQALKVASTVLVISAVIYGVGFSTLLGKMYTLKLQIAHLNEQKNLITQLRGAHKAETEKKQSLDYRQQLVLGFQRGPHAPTVLEIVDKALEDKKVQFVKWNYSKNISKHTTPTNQRQNGFSLIVPGGTQSEHWLIDTKMNIKGAASNHADLSKFVESLSQKPGVQSVRIVKTSLSKAAKTVSVSFELDIIVNNPPLQVAKSKT